jgi:hypothetical protein
MSRKLLLTDELQKRICIYIADGNYAVTACAMAGISESVYYHWLQLGEKGGYKNARYVEFLESIKRAEAEAEARNLRVIQVEVQNRNWCAAAWYLERKHANRWGKQDRLKTELTGKGGEPVQIEGTFAEIVKAAMIPTDAPANTDTSPSTENSPNTSPEP